MVFCIFEPLLKRNRNLLSDLQKHDSANWPSLRACGALKCHFQTKTFFSFFFKLTCMKENFNTCSLPYYSVGSYKCFWEKNCLPMSHNIGRPSVCLSKGPYFDFWLLYCPCPTAHDMLVNGSVAWRVAMPSHLKGNVGVGIGVGYWIQNRRHWQLGQTCWPWCC